MSDKDFKDHLLLLISLQEDEKFTELTGMMSNGHLLGGEFVEDHEVKSETEKYLDWIFSL